MCSLLLIFNNQNSKLIINCTRYNICTHTNNAPSTHTKHVQITQYQIPATKTVEQQPPVYQAAPAPAVAVQAQIPVYTIPFFHKNIHISPYVPYPHKLPVGSNSQHIHILTYAHRHTVWKPIISSIWPNTPISSRVFMCVSNIHVHHHSALQSIICDLFENVSVWI